MSRAGRGALPGPLAGARIRAILRRVPATSTPARVEPIPTPMGLRRLATLFKTHQFLRFLLAGGLNTLFGFCVYALSVLAGLPVWLAMLVGTVAGIAFNFVTLGGYAFRDLSARRLPRFVLGYAGVYGVNLAAFDLVHRRVANPVACQVLLVVPVALFSYLVMSRFVFRKRREV